MLVSSVTVPGTGGVIIMTSCPGRGDNIFSEPSSALLETHVKIIAKQGATAVVTLMDRCELDLLRMNDLPGMFATQGIEWFHLPIASKSLPSDEFESLWEKEGSRLRSMLRRGGKIAVHCRVGVNRTGLIAARLLIEMGTDTDEAIDLIREKLNGSLQIWSQIAYCRSIRPVD